MADIEKVFPGPSTTEARMTAAEFRQRPETNLPTELIEGEVIVSPAPVDRHQAALANAYDLLRPISRATHGSVLRFAPCDVYLDEVNVVQPDLFWVSGADSRCQLRGDYWYGAPDLVIEILSPGTKHRDRAEKFLLYEKYGVREYWIVDLDTQTLEQWLLADGRFVGGSVFGVTTVFGSPTLGGVSIAPSAIFSD